MAGADGVTTAMFGREVGPRLAVLSGLLRDGRYRAQPLRPVRVVRGGKVRVRGVPTVCDRVVQRAFLNVCGARLLTANPVSFSYRRGRSWLNAVEQVRAYRDVGLTWVLRTDIADFFAEIDQRLLLDRVAEQTADPQITELVGSWVRAPVITAAGLERRARGLPEGAPVSPTLAELFLAGFDRDVDRGPGRLVRYADDLAVLCRTPQDALAALGSIENALAVRGLRVNEDKTAIASFDFGFTLLGWQFTAHEARPLDAVEREGGRR
jgi:RNA-directed DNA polymerase